MPLRLLSSVPALLLGLASSFSLAATRPVPQITQPIVESQRITLEGNTRLEARNPANDRGAVADDFALPHMWLQLKRSPTQEAALITLIDQLHDPRSAQYHQWLTPQQFASRFGVPEQDIATVTTWLEGHGFHVDAVLPNRMVIEFSGNAGMVRDAFHTEIHHITVAGEEHFANVSEPQIPAALAPAVVGVVALHDFQPISLVAARNKREAALPRPEYTSGVNYDMVPADAQTIYNLAPVYNAGYSGQSQTIGIIGDADPYTTADFTTYRTKFGLASSYPSGNVTVMHPSGSATCTAPGTNGDTEETELDMEMATAIAPNATVQIATCKSGTVPGVLIAAQNLINGTSVPPVLSMSYGECEQASGATQNAAFSTAFQQAAAQGISVFVSAGDNGAAGCEESYVEPAHNYAEFGPAVSAFSGTPYNVSVGGTDFDDTAAGTSAAYWSTANATNYGSAKSYVPEIPWANSCAAYVSWETAGSSSGITYCNTTAGEAYLDDAGGGGGQSGCFTGAPNNTGGSNTGTCGALAKPTWQTGVYGIPSASKRYQPDISLFAANNRWKHEWVICYSDTTNKNGHSCSGEPSTWTGVGGTSASSPAMAAIQLLIDQKYGLQGNPNYIYYPLAAAAYGASGNANCNANRTGGPSSTCVFNDITLGDNTVNCKGTVGCFLPQGQTNGVLSTSDSSFADTWSTGTGYDLATGIGSVNAGNLFAAWNTVSTGSKIGTTLSARVAVSPVQQGAAETLLALLTYDSGSAPTGTVSYSIDGGSSANLSCSGSSSPLTCTANIPTASLSVATHNVAVKYAGSSADYPSSATASFSVTASSPPPSQSFTLSDLYDFGEAGVEISSALVQGIDGNFYGVAGPINISNSTSGVIFKLDASNNYAYSILHTFDAASEGIYGTGLTVGPDGTMYGVTGFRYSSSGNIDGGVYYSITTAGVFTKLHAFNTSEYYGAGPQIVPANDGNFYATSSNGGSNDQGAIFQLTPAGGATLLYSFDGTIGNSTGGPIPALVQASDGNFYGGIAQDDGVHFGTIYKMVKSGSTFTVSAVHNLALAEGYGPNSALVEGANGELYGTTECGGTGTDVSCGDGTIFDVTLGGSLTKLVDFSTANAGFEGVPPFLLGGDGNFYGMTGESGQGNYFGTFFRMTPTGAISTPGESDNNSSKLGAANYQITQASDGSFLVPSGGAGGYGDILRLGVSPAVPAPITLTASGTPKVGQSFNLNYVVSNAFSDSMQQCYINAVGKPTGAGASGLKAAGVSTANGFVGSTAVSPTAAGTYTYVLTCGGIESAFLNVTAASGSLGASISASATPDPVITGNNVTLNVNVSSSTGTPAGSINFKYSGTVVDTTHLDSNGNATWIANTNGLGASTYPIEVDYVPSDAHTATSTTIPVQVVNKTASTTTVTLTPSSVPSGNAITVTATVTGTAPTGTVTLYLGGTAIGSYPLTAKNSTTATLTLTPTTTGFIPTTYTVKATYSGDSKNNTSSGSATATVTPSSQVIITATPNPVPPNGTVTLTFKAQANGYNGPVATGSMNIKLNGVNYTTVPLSNGQAQFPYDTTGFPPGGYTLTGTYLPDANSTYPSSSTTYVVSLN